MGGCGLRDEEAALDGGTERCVDISLRDLLELLGLETGRGPVDDDVEPTELRGRSLDERSARLGPGEIAVTARGGENLPPALAERGGYSRAELSGAAGEEGAWAYLAGSLSAASKRLATSPQSTTFHQAAR
jgi:hypothetical protein